MRGLIPQIENRINEICNMIVDDDNIEKLEQCKSMLTIAIQTIIDELS